MITADRLKYFLHGVAGRFRQQRLCPCCRIDESEPVDRKWTFTLLRCRRCGLLFRFPGNTAPELMAYYQTEYDPGGLTTDLPSELELKQYMDANFVGTSKDFSNLVALLEGLSVKPGAQILDFGANWGYLTYQLRRAGYSAAAFEISVPRAAFGRNLGVDICTSIDAVPGPFDVVYSSHVLEHVIDPRATLTAQWGRVRAGGLLLGHTPNGSPQHRRVAPKAFHESWGQVHPMLLTADFLDKLFPDSPMYVSSESDPTSIARWDRESRVSTALGGGELFFAIRKQDSSSLHR